MDIEIVHKLLKIILGHGGSFYGKTISQMTDEDKVHTLGHMIKRTVEHAQSQHADLSIWEQY